MNQAPTIIIEPGRRPKAYLADLWRYRDLIWLFVKRDFTAAYKQTILGPLWHFIKPILTTLVSFVLFNVVAGISTNGTHPVLFQMSGIIIWNYFAACFTTTGNTFLANAGIFGKVYFPRLVTPISVVISQLVQFGIQLVLLLVVTAYFMITQGPCVVSQCSLFTVNWLLVPVILLLMAALGLGAGIILSSITTKYRDLAVLVGFGIQLLMYASAVNYPVSALAKHPQLYLLVRYNPLAALVESFRNAVLGGSIPWGMLAYSAGITALLLALGIWLFSRVERTFMDTV
ncbi:MAG TPA: ABC transporter permease [Phnomibacter sp.]|nr:ABC transporter permease [Phnomibacter sp.]